MMLECRTGELLSSAAFMHHVDQWHTVLTHYAALKGLSSRHTNWTRCLNEDRYGIGQEADSIGEMLTVYVETNPNFTCK